MPRFRYTAIDLSGQTARGEIEAETEADVVHRLQREGKLPLRAEPAGRAGLLDVLQADLGGGLRRQEVTEFTRELSIMLSTGQDLDRTLRFLVETAPNKRVRNVTERLRDNVRDGGALAAAMARQPRSFPPLYVGLVRAGEAGGTLAATLERLAGLLERERRLSATIRTAMIYPTLLLLVATGAIVMLLTYVLPQFVPLFKQNGAALPPSARFMVDAGNFLGRDGLLILLAIALLGLVLAQALRRPALRLRADLMILRLPIVGGLAREIIAARFSRTLGTLLTNAWRWCPRSASCGTLSAIWRGFARSSRRR